MTTVENYFHQYEQNLYEYYPGTTHFLWSPEFLTSIVDGFLIDGGFCSDSENLSLADLKRIFNNLKTAVARIDSFRNNDIFDNIQNFVKNNRNK